MAKASQHASWWKTGARRRWVGFSAVTLWAKFLWLKGLCSIDDTAHVTGAGVEIRKVHRPIFGGARMSASIGYWSSKLLNTTVASVSRRISEFEDQLGVKLFTTTTRHAPLNPDGETYLAHFREALRLLTAAEDELTDRQAGPTGQIRMTTAVEFGERVIAAAISTFQRLHPRVSIDLDLSNDRFDLIEGKYDLAVHLGEFPDSSLIARKIGERRLLACSLSDNVERCGHPNEPADLRNHNFLRGSVRQWRFLRNGTSTQHMIRRGHRFRRGAIQRF